MTKPSFNSSGSSNNANSTNSNTSPVNNSSTTATTTTATATTTINNNTNSNLQKKPRRSIKAEGTCLNGMLREGCAKVIDASKLGKRLSSEIWNSFGAIQVQDSFTYPSIDTKTVADGTSTMKICQFFVACSRCFSVFKYDGHAYGTTGLVKHVKNCPRTRNFGQDNSHSLSSVPNSSNTFNGPVTTRRKITPKRPAQPSLRHLAKVIEELRNEQTELKQRINDMISLMGNSYVGQIQIIQNDSSDKVDEAIAQKDD